MRRLTMLPLMASLAALLLAGALACTPKAPEPAAGAGTPAPKEETADAPDPAPVEVAPAESTPAPADAVPAEGAATTFDTANFYAMNCSGCHGVEGMGTEKGPAYSKVLHEPDEELIAMILGGKMSKDGTEVKMPAFQDKLSADEAKMLVAWLHTEFGTVETPPAE